MFEMLPGTSKLSLPNLLSCPCKPQDDIKNIVKYCTALLVVTWAAGEYIYHIASYIPRLIQAPASSIEYLHK